MIDTCELEKICSKITKKETQCKNKTKNGENYCHIHMKNRCVSINKRNKRCSNFAKSGNLCFAHNKAASIKAESIEEEFVNLENFFDENTYMIKNSIYDSSDSDSEILLSTILCGDGGSDGSSEESEPYDKITKIFNLITLKNICVSDQENSFWRTLSYTLEDDFKIICMKENKFISSNLVELYEIPIISKILKKKINVYLIRHNSMISELCVYSCHPNGTSEIIPPENNSYEDFDINICYKDNHYFSIK